MAKQNNAAQTNPEASQNTDEYLKGRIIMITKATSTSLLIAVLTLVGCNSQNDQPKTPKEKPAANNISYNIGLLIGSQAKAQYDEIDFAALQEGITKAYKGEAKESDYAEASDILHSYNHIQMTKKSKEATEKGLAYRTENAKRPGVTVTKSGLQYEVIQEGTGPNPSVGDTVTIHYRGTLVDGTEFDSSISRGTPAVFPLKNLIKAWQEGVPLMKTGAKYRFVTPPELAYGENNPGRIPPNSTLIFEIELIKIGAPDPVTKPGKPTSKP